MSPNNQSRLNRFLVGILLILVSVSVSIVCAELVVRLFAQKPTPVLMETEGKVIDEDIVPGLTKSKDPIQLFELRPSQSVCFEERCETINGHGFRGVEVDLRDRNPFRIAVLGDSFTYGYGVDDHETLPVHLERILNANGKRGIQVLNFGIGGYNSVQVARLIRNKVIAFNPNIVIYNYFPNDAELYRQEGNPLLYECASMFSWKRPVFKTLASSHLVEFIARRIGLRHVTRHGQDPNYWNLIHHPFWPGWWVVKLALEEMKKTTEEAGIPFCVVLLPYDDLPSQSKKENIGRIIELCERLDIPVIDISGCFVDVRSYDGLWTSVGPPHYSNRGNKLVAEEILKKLAERSLIQRAPNS